MQRTVRRTVRLSLETRLWLSMSVTLVTEPFFCMIIQLPTTLAIVLFLLSLLQEQHAISLITLAFLLSLSLSSVCLVKSTTCWLVLAAGSQSDRWFGSCMFCKSLRHMTDVGGVSATTRKAGCMLGCLLMNECRFALMMHVVCG